MATRRQNTSGNTKTTMITTRMITGSLLHHVSSRHCEMVCMVSCTFSWELCGCG